MKTSEFFGNVGAVILSVLVHGGIIAALLWQTDLNELVSIKLQDEVEEVPNIEAVVVDTKVINAQAEKIRQKKEEARRREEDRIKRLEQQSAQLVKEREAEEKRLRELKAKNLAAEKAARDAERERKRIAEEQKKIQEAVRVAEQKAQEAEEKRIFQLAEAKKAEQAAKEAEELRLKQLAEVKKAEQAAKEAEKARKEAELAKKEMERLAKEAAKRKAEQEAAAKELFSELESETTGRNSAREKSIANEVNEWSTRYTSMIKQRWNSGSFSSGKTCRLSISLARNGLVLSVKKISGNDAVCRSAEASVYKINQFPMPDDPEVVNKLRSINLNFEK